MENIGKQRKGQSPDGLAGFLGALLERRGLRHLQEPAVSQVLRAGCKIVCLQAATASSGKPKDAEAVEVEAVRSLLNL